MAFSKKKKRKVVINEKTYYWSATGNDDWISLCVMTEIAGSSRLNCKFNYHSLSTESTNGSVLTKQFIITPYTVRQVIIYALSIGWNPFEKGRDLDLHHTDSKIDLRLDKNREFNERKLWFQFSLDKAQAIK